MLVLATELASSAPNRGPQPTLTLLDRYRAGQFDAVVSELRTANDFASTYDDLKTHGQAWIDADRPDRDRRRLAAATFALEAARVGADADWKEVRMFMRLENIYWKPPALLLEWGCQVMRRSPEPSPAEHAWQLAALSVIGHAQDSEFAIGSPWKARANPRDEILHLEHAIARFPRDSRLLLARGIAAELQLFPNARDKALKDTRAIFLAQTIVKGTPPPMAGQRFFVFLKSNEMLLDQRSLRATDRFPILAPIHSSVGFLEIDSLGNVNVRPTVRRKLATVNGLSESNFRQQLFEAVKNGGDSSK